MLTAKAGVWGWKAPNIPKLNHKTTCNIYNNAGKLGTPKLHSYQRVLFSSCVCSSTAPKTPETSQIQIVKGKNHQNN